MYETNVKLRKAKVTRAGVSFGRGVCACASTVCACRVLSWKLIRLFVRSVLVWNHTVLFSHESLQSTRKTAAVPFHVQEWLGLVCHPGSQLEPPCYAALLEMPVQPSALGVGLYPKTPCYTRYMFRGHCEEDGYCRQGPTTPAVAFKIVRETFLEPS